MNKKREKNEQMSAKAESIAVIKILFFSKASFPFLLVGCGRALRMV
jgi:hypothetical protein